MPLLRRSHDRHRNFRWPTLSALSRPQARRLIARRIPCSLDPERTSRTPVATTRLCPGCLMLQLPRSFDPTKPTTRKSRSLQTPNSHGAAQSLGPFRPCSPSRPRLLIQSNIHSPDSWSAVSSNEGSATPSKLQCLIVTTVMASQKPHHSANSSEPRVRFGSILLKNLYSITSSARPRRGSGTVRPSALAVLRVVGINRDIGRTR